MVKNQTLGERIRARRTELGLTLEAVGRAVGVGRSTVYKWETGSITSMGQDKISALAAVLQLPAPVLLGWEELFPADCPELSPARRLTCPSSEGQEQTLFGPPGTAARVDFCLKVSDDAMAGAGIQAGDTVLLQKQDAVAEGALAAVRIGDKVLLRRVFRDPESRLLALFAENPRFPTLRFRDASPEQPVILGLAVGLTRMFPL